MTNQRSSDYLMMLRSGWRKSARFATSELHLEALLLSPTCQFWDVPSGRFGLRFQPVDATLAQCLLAGVERSFVSLDIPNIPGRFQPITAGDSPACDTGCHPRFGIFLEQ